MSGTIEDLPTRVALLEQALRAVVPALERIERRLDATEARMDKRFDALEARFDRVDKRFDDQGYQTTANLRLMVTLLVSVIGVMVAGFVSLFGLLTHAIH